jgi:DHA3 family tetracycline resistance protein-like MFS transporter
VGGGLALASVRLSLLAGGAAEASLALVVAFAMTERGYAPVPRGVRSSWAAARDTALDGLRAARRRPLLIAALAIAALVGMSSESFDRLWPYHLLKGGFAVPGGLSDVVLFATIQVVAQLGGIIAIRLAERGADFDRAGSVARRLFVVNAVIVAGMAAFGLAGGFAFALGAYWVVQWARQVEAPFFIAWVNRGLDPRTRATVLSTVSQANALGQVAGGPAFGVLATLATVRAALVTAAAVLAPTLPVYLRHRGEDAGAAPPREP